MAIEFTCPNGHVLSASEDKAGRTAKCPKCGSAVRIPGGSSASGKGLLAGTGTADAPALPPGTIMFLCPNGHRLNGPMKLQGRAGQCPHCGAKFRIPFQDPAEEEAFQAAQAAESSQESPEFAASDSPVADEPLEEYTEELPDQLEEFAEQPEVDLSQHDLAGEDGHAADDEYVATEPGWPTLFPYLWKQKSPGSEVDLYLNDGTKLTPKWFSPTWSFSKQGVFAIRDMEGSYTILSVAWDSILRVEVRSVIDLPDGMFE